MASTAKRALPDARTDGNIHEVTQIRRVSF
jgi:hypothetical protein